MFLQAKRAAALLDLPVSTFYGLVREGRLPPAVSKVGKHRLWRRADLIASVDPEGYKASHEKAQASTGHPPAGKGKRQGAVLLAPRSRHASGGTARQAAGRSPYAGILGSAGESADLDRLDYLNPRGLWQGG